MEGLDETPVFVDRIEQVAWITFFFLGLVRAVVAQVGIEVDYQLSRLVQGAVELVVGHMGDIFVGQDFTGLEVLRDPSRNAWPERLVFPVERHVSLALVPKDSR